MVQLGLLKPSLDKRVHRFSQLGLPNVPNVLQKDTDVVGLGEVVHGDVQD